MKIVIDTSLLIDFTRRKKKSEENLYWTSLVSYSRKEGHQLIVPPVVVFEFFSGDEMNKPENQKKAEEILRDTIMDKLDSETAKKAASLLRGSNINVGTIDYLITAATILCGGELATLNPKHFSIFKDLKLFDFKKLDKV